MPVCQFQHQRAGRQYYNRLAFLVKHTNNSQNTKEIRKWLESL